MKLIRWLLLFILVLGCSIAGSFPITGLWGTSLQALPVPQLPSATPAKPLSALKLDLKKLTQTLDRNDIAAAVQQVEVGWKQQYEDYYQGQLTSSVLSAKQIGYSLNRIAQLTGKKTALVYVISTPNQLELMLVPPSGKLGHRRVTAANQKLLPETIKTFELGVVNVNSQPSDYLPAAQQLYQWIIAPLESELKAQQIDTLIFCLGGGLRSVPIAALHDGHRFLVENYSLAIIPAFQPARSKPCSSYGHKSIGNGSFSISASGPSSGGSCGISYDYQALAGGILVKSETSPWRN